MTIVREVNLDTNEVIDREMTDQELTQSEVDHAAQMAKEAEADAQATARAAILDRLGLTDAEAKLLLS
jgi:hypothetical protein